MTATTVEARLAAATARMHEPWGGLLCLDFANTLEPRGGPPPFAAPPGARFRDELLSYDDLIAWTVHKEALPAALGIELIAVADVRPERAAAVLARARTLRDAVYRVFWAVANTARPDADDLAILAREHADGVAAAELVATASGAAWEWPMTTADLARPLWPVAWSATELLTSGDPTRVKVCPGVPDQPVACAWLFFDATRNRSRRWCSMIDCGGGTKARRQTARRRQARTQTAARD